MNLMLLNVNAEYMDFVVFLLNSSGYETDVIVEKKKLDTAKYSCFECFKIVL